MARGGGFTGKGSGASGKTTVRTPENVAELKTYTITTAVADENDIDVVHGAGKTDYMVQVFNAANELMLTPVVKHNNKAVISFGAETQVNTYKVIIAA